MTGTILPLPTKTLIRDPIRLAVLRELDILDTVTEPGFDDLAIAASALCDMPIALVSLVDEHRQWFKARVGLELCETPVEQAICALTLEDADLLVIPDLTRDPRTWDNPLVTQKGGLRFYAGAPLRTPEGLGLGSLCVIDRKAHPEGLSEAQKSGLSALARQVMTLFAMRRHIEDREASLVTQVKERQALRQWMESVHAAQAAGHIAIFRYHLDSGEFSVSPEAQDIFGLTSQQRYGAEDFLGLILDEDRHIVSTPENRVNGTAPLDVVYRIRRADDGQIRWIARKASWERDETGAITTMVGAIQDVTDETLLREELAHRLKNMMSMVMAIASQTLRSVKERDAIEAFEQRLIALAGANDILVRRQWASARMRDAISRVIATLGMEKRIHASGPDMLLGARATVGLSLVVHELATNALKYGALAQPVGSASLAWTVEQTDGAPQLVLIWTETGGLPVTAPTRQGFGSRLISMGLLGTGGGSVDYKAEGLCARITAPLDKIAE